MSFDLYFVARWKKFRWDPMASELPESPFEARSGPSRRTLKRVEKAVLAEFPAAESHTEEHSCEIFDHDSGLQVCMYPGETVVSVPYWHEGEAAEKLEVKLRRVVAGIESATRQVCYDPQANDGFLRSWSRGSSAPSAAKEMTRVRSWMRGL